jgi:predicted HTH domain antitoxin
MSDTRIMFEISADVISALGETEAALTTEARLSMAMHLFTSRKLSAGKAAKVAGMDKWQFIMEMGKNGISYIDYSSSELEKELAQMD